MAKETVKGRGITIHFDGERCIHSRNCVLTHPDVFVPNVEGEWIHPEAVEQLLHGGRAARDLAPVEAGEGGIDNLQANQLANRTAFLKQKTDE